jgi:hypothetical protein
MMTRTGGQDGIQETEERAQIDRRLQRQDLMLKNSTQVSPLSFL